MLIEIDNAQFVHGDVERATGIDRVLLQAWNARGHLPAVERNPGTGHRRLYSLRVLIVLAAAIHLTKFGILIAEAMQIASTFGAIFQPQGGRLDTSDFERFESYWIAIGKDEKGKLYASEKPWSIRHDWDEAQYKRHFRARHHDKVMLILDLGGIVAPVLSAVEKSLSEK